MRLAIVATVSLILLPLLSMAVEEQKVYRWVDEDGDVHYGDSVPAKYADAEKQILNREGVQVGHIDGKKTAEEIAEEERLAELRREEELQRRKDDALLATYRSVEEIETHKERRVELFKAQARVTEMFLRQMMRHMATLREEASQYRPYSDDPDAAMIDPELAEEILVTKATIKRHQENLDRFREDEQDIVERFDGDIDRFKYLTGLANQGS
jgi:hypothetical protein